MDQPILERVIPHSTTHFSLGDIKGMVADQSLIVAPAYQREFRLDKKKASRLVESVLMGLPIPSVCFHELDDDDCQQMEVIDGQTRIMSFILFLENEYALEGLSNLTELNKKYFRDLTTAQQNMIRRRFQLRATIVQNSMPDIQYEIFSRLNKGSVKLNSQEIRNCIYHGRFNRMLKEAADDKRVRRTFTAENKRYSYEEKILRFFTLRECAEEHEDFRSYSGCLSRKMDAYMENHKDDDADSVKKLKSLFLRTLDIVIQILGEDVFICISNSAVSFSGSIYDSIMVPFSFYPPAQLISHADEIRSYIRSLRDNNLYYACTTNTNTGNTKYTATRINLVRAGLDQIMGKDDPDAFLRYFRKDIMASVRADLFAPGCKCPLCGQEILDVKDTELDHILPYSKGGKTVLENIQLTHRICNRHKHNNIPSCQKGDAV